MHHLEPKRSSPKQSRQRRQCSEWMLIMKNNISRPNLQFSSSKARQAGISLLEVLISIVIIAIGILGLAGLQARATNAEFESYQRSQAIILANDMVDRIRMNRANKGSFKNISDSTTGTGYLGTTGDDSYAVSCPGSTQAEIDLCEWNDLLQGSNETLGTDQVGAMIGARGCIFYDSTTEVSGIADTGLFTVAVAWQGASDTVAPTVNCGNGLYGSETKRRVVTMSFRLAKLS